MPRTIEICQKSHKRYIFAFIYRYFEFIFLKSKFAFNLGLTHYRQTSVLPLETVV